MQSDLYSGDPADAIRPHDQHGTGGGERPSNPVDVFKSTEAYLGFTSYDTKNSTTGKTTRMYPVKRPSAVLVIENVPFTKISYTKQELYQADYLLNKQGSLMS